MMLKEATVILIMMEYKSHTSACATQASRALIAKMFRRRAEDLAEKIVEIKADVLGDNAFVIFGLLERIAVRLLVIIIAMIRGVA